MPDVELMEMTINEKIFSFHIHLDELKSISIGELIDKILSLKEHFFTEIVLPSESRSPLKLKFFTNFDTVEKQDLLRKAIKHILPTMDEKNGRDWISLHIAHAFSFGKRILLNNYTDFFADIDALVPDVLTNVDYSQTTNALKYKNYSQALGKECPNWYIQNDCLPPLNEWTSSSYKYNAAKKRQGRIIEQVIETLKIFTIRQ